MRTAARLAAARLGSQAAASSLGSASQLGSSRLAAASRRGGASQRQLSSKAAGSGQKPTAPDNAAYDASGKPLPSIPDATTLFKLSNPELMLDPRKSASWMVVGSVIVAFAAILTFTAYREGLLSDGGQKLAEQYAEEVKQELDVRQVLPDGRLLMRDGSIRKAPPK